MPTLAEICRPIEAELQQYQTMLVDSLQHDNPLLHQAVEHILQRKGKQMRPILVLLSAKLVGRVTEEVLHAAVALELLHTASLVHDDVVDESDRRRGQKSINALMGNRVAILVGDYLFSRTLHHTRFTNSDAAVQWVATLGQTLSDGELQQLANTKNPHFIEDFYYEVIKKKTASLFATCAKMGAHLAGGDEEMVRLMEMFGECVGICFQLRDDIFDYDPTNDTGKPTGNDMKEGKLTLPVLHALIANGDERHRSLALRVRQGEATDAEISQLIDFAKRNGGIEYAVSAMNDYSCRALALLDECPPSPAVADVPSVAEAISSLESSSSSSGVAASSSGVAATSSGVAAYSSGVQEAAWALEANRLSESFVSSRTL